MSSCWDIKGCPASHYMDCVAYKQQTNCWELQKGCLCNAYEACAVCPIYKEHGHEDADLSQDD